jgi:DNA-binding NtrC family response regulator
MAKILVLDDSRSILDMVVQMLKRAGHDVRPSTTAKEAFEVLQSEPVDLLITDIYMPDVDGLEVILKARRLHPRLKFIAMSSMRGPMNMLGAAKAFGAAVTLPKPFSMAALYAAVSEALDPGKQPPDPAVAKLTEQGKLQ